MTIVDVLAKNARIYESDVALVELNPEQQENRRLT